MANFSFVKSFAGAIPIPDAPNTSRAVSVLSVAPPPIPTGALVTGIEIVHLDIVHSNNADLDIRLVNPNGLSIELSSDNGGTGDNYVDVTFSDLAPKPLPQGDVTIKGPFHAETPLAALLGGTIAGNWSLTIVDDTSGNAGTLLNWGIRFNVAYSGTVTGTHKSEMLDGSDQADRIFGLAGNDSIHGFAGNDWIWGGRGADIMCGGAGSDRFIYESRFESGTTGTTADVIKDFGPTDVIDLRAIDANELKFGNQNFKFIATQAFHHVAGELRTFKFNPPGTPHDLTFVQADVNGDAHPDFMIGLTGLHNLNAQDFVL